MRDPEPGRPEHGGNPSYRSFTHKPEFWSGHRPDVTGLVVGEGHGFQREGGEEAWGRWRLAYNAEVVSDEKGGGGVGRGGGGGDGRWR